MQKVLRDSTLGFTLAFITFILLFSSVPLQPAAAADQQPLFSMTMIAPTSNPARRQWAAIIASSYQQVGIDAKLVFMDFGPLLDRVFGSATGPLWSQGGYDAVFIGWGGGTILPDFGTTNVINYRDEGAGDIPPLGNNYAFFNNATLNNLMDQYAVNFDSASRTQMAHEMISIVAQQRPYLVLFYPAQSQAFANYFYPWGVQNAWTATTSTLDYEYWKSTGSTSLNLAETGDINSVYALPSSVSNSQYNKYLWGLTSAYLQDLDARTLTYFNALATSITSTPDHLTWTVKFRPHTFQDGVPVTADDYVFTYMSNLRTDTQPVQLGTYQGVTGLNTTFTYLNGTTRYISNGTYYGSSPPSGFKATGTFESDNSTAFTFTVPKPYIFTNPLLTGIGALPMHIYEQVPANTWPSSFLGAVGNTPHTVHWNSQRYGGNGSYAYVYGPIGDGPYIYKGYDKVAQVGTMVKFDNYWNATGLQSMGEFVIKEVHIVHILDKDAALAAFKNGQINAMDYNYQFEPTDIQAIKSYSGYAVTGTDPSAGWQEMGLNLHHAVYGTGTGTPLGQSDPAKASYAAMMVRKALSYLVPRQYIIDNLLQGQGLPGTTQFGPWKGLQPAGLQPDPYDPTMAKSFLAAAGYQTGVAPPTTGGTVTLPAVPSIPPIVINNTSVQLNVKIPTFLLGNTFTVTGSFSVDPVLGAESNGFAVTLQQSTDGAKTWSPVALGSTNAGGYYSLSYAPTATGNVTYRVFFTGLPETTVLTNGLHDPALVESLVPPQASTRPLNVTDIGYGPNSTLDIGTLGDLVSGLTSAIEGGFSATSTQIGGLAGAVNTRIGQLRDSVSSLQSSTQNSLNQLQSNSASKGDVSNLQNSVNSLNSQVATLNNQISTLNTVAYAAIGIAIVLGLIAIGLAARKRS